jgi:hypothetical protein
VFKYLENKDPGWKKKGIEDGDMLVTDFKCDGPEDQKRLDSLKTSCYLNIAGTSSLVACCEMWPVNPLVTVVQRPS